MSLSEGQVIALAIAPMVTGCMSFLASSTILIMILRSKVKLSTIYRRLIFGMSSFDVIQSLEQASSVIPLPEGWPVWGAMGNLTTCNMKGFFNTIGITGAVFYSLSQSMYFITVIKLNVDEQTIKRKIEPFLHAIPILLAFGSSVFLLATDNYGPVAMTCWIAPKPLNCNLNPNVPCTSYGNLVVLRWVLGGVPVFFVFACNCIMLLVIWHAEYSQNRRNRRYAVSWRENPSTCQSTGNGSSIIGSTSSFLARSRDIFRRPSQRPCSSAAKRRHQIAQRALWFILAFILTYIFTITTRILLDKSPYFLQFLSRLFIPLQGFFNILVFTSPHVAGYRQKNPECSWFRAFWNVMKSGGDKDVFYSTRRGKGASKLRRKSLRKEPVVMDMEVYNSIIKDKEPVVMEPVVMDMEDILEAIHEGEVVARTRNSILDSV
mmetsp:Transcript_3601/g.5318  ORF Transcript_3601/g.5318 Transcript_3601/m.5318 type:complete len:433 (+) Transcript_3601:130-1428(+)|eukprot:CAMPEP_0194229842 /NCGR_PEP_ID=MMETSP0156-20130528/44102_1 /TAXON_ID=33649 /ORGANISM="Thalassionema nitzschioides, Strain L26-B" /LENGTH=432 /DNA_ID=CAMNT_0038962405 /DNA_START=111 /DNA_END=1409 /DNA_ORIENTATION=-